MNARGCSFDLLGHPMIAHLFIPGSMCARSNYCLSLLSGGYMWYVLSSPSHIVGNVFKLDSTTSIGD